MSAFHTGEVLLQERLGVHERLAQIGRSFVRPFMPDQHRRFYAQLPFLVAGTVDPEGAVWATVLSGPVGFAQSPDPRHLALALDLEPADPATAGMGDGAAIGLLGIELETRRRNRVNGRLSVVPGGVRVAVEHSFGNCPKYIRRRQLSRITELERPPARWSRGLPGDVRASIEAADTFFVASYADLEQGRQIDASHRGGPPGFVQVDAEGALVVPDYAGNRFFNTLGNFMVNPRAGLLFVDFETGDLIQLTGTVEVLLDDPRTAAFEGAERLWRFSPTRTVVRPRALGLRAVVTAPAAAPRRAR